MQIVTRLICIGACLMAGMTEVSFAEDNHKTPPLTEPAMNHVTTKTVAERVVGQWEGTWTTERDGGDKGPLKCTVTEQADGKLTAKFRATYKKVLPFVHTVLLTAEQKDGHIAVTGNAELAGWAGGKYTYTGKVNGESFVCEYVSDKDKGVFDLKRVK